MKNKTALEIMLFWEQKLVSVLSPSEYRGDERIDILVGYANHMSSFRAKFVCVDWKRFLLDESIKQH